MSGFEKQTYTQMPNSLFKIMGDMDECELKVVLLICRYTFGYHRDEIKISTRKIAEEIQMSVASVDKGADAAVKRGLIERITDGQKTTVWRAIVSDSEIETLSKEVIQKVNQGDSEIETQLGLNKDKENKKQKKGDIIDGMLEYAKQSNGKAYPLREKIPEPYLEYADWYVKATGQTPRKKNLFEWLSEFADWTNASLCVKDLQNAYEYANRPSGGFLVGRPGSLTNTAIALKSKPSYAPAIDQSSVDATRRMLEEKEQIKATPPPASIRQLMKGMQS